jgi:hypothetical protein
MSNEHLYFRFFVVEGIECLIVYVGIGCRESLYPKDIEIFVYVQVL